MSPADVPHDAPLHLVFMGVSGSGKSTAMLAVRDLLGWESAEGDDFHPPANVAKMASGRPLTDADRWGWLESLAAWTKERDDAGTPTLISCSALKRSYRDVLRRGGDGTFFVHMVGSRELLLERMEGRSHFMPASLLDSQIETLEDLDDDEQGMEVDVAATPDEVTDMVLRRLGLADRP